MKVETRKLWITVGAPKKPPLPVVTTHVDGTAPHVLEIPAASHGLRVNPRIGFCVPAILCSP